MISNFMNKYPIIIYQLKFGLRTVHKPLNDLLLNSSLFEDCYVFWIFNLLNNEMYLLLFDWLLMQVWHGHWWRQRFWEEDAGGDQSEGGKWSWKQFSFADADNLCCLCLSYMEWFTASKNWNSIVRPFRS